MAKLTGKGSLGNFSDTELKNLGRLGMISDKELELLMGKKSKKQKKGFAKLQRMRDASATGKKGFDKLRQMRDASATGGLGAISEKELELLMKSASGMAGGGRVKNGRDGIAKSGLTKAPRRT